MNSALLVGERGGVGPLAGVLGEVERLRAPLLVLPAREEPLVGGRGLHDPVQAGHHPVDVGVQQHLERLVLVADLLLGRSHAGNYYPIDQLSQAPISSTWRMLATSSCSLLRLALEPAVEDLATAAARWWRAATAPARWRRSSAARRGRSRRPRTGPRARRAPCSPRSTRRCRSSSTPRPARLRPSATSRAACSLAHAQSSRSDSSSAPCSSGSWPRLRSSSTSASATPVRSSAATEIFTATSAPAPRADPHAPADRDPPALGGHAASRGAGSGRASGAGPRRTRTLRVLPRAQA